MKNYCLDLNLVTVCGQCCIRTIQQSVQFKKLLKEKTYFFFATNQQFIIIIHLTNNSYSLHYIFNTLHFVPPFSHASMNILYHICICRWLQWHISITLATISYILELCHLNRFASFNVNRVLFFDLKTKEKNKFKKKSYHATRTHNPHPFTI